MRVGVDATSWPNRRGYGRFVRNVVTRLVELDRDTSYVLMIDAASANGVGLPSGAEQCRVGLSRAPSEAAAAGSRRSVSDMVRLMRAVRQQRLDAFLFPSSYTYFPVPGTPVVLGLHDATPEQFPDLTFPDRRSRALWRAKQALAIRSAKAIFTVSAASRAALTEHFGFSDVAIVPEAPDPVFSPRGGAAVTAALDSLGLRREEFLLFAGGVSPHKNVETLLRAYSMLRDRRHEMPPLVLVGDLDKDPFLSAADSVRREIAQLGLEGDVRLPGFVSDETLACLYTASTAVVLPSLSEGFGLPAVEAAACGAPTVLSDLPAHRETLQDAARYFPPTAPDRLADELEALIDDERLRRDLGERGRAAVAQLTWDRSAESLREILAGTVRAAR